MTSSSRAAGRCLALAHHVLLLALPLFLAGCVVAQEAKPPPVDALVLQLGERPPLRLDAAALRQQPAETLEVRWQRGDNLETPSFRGTPLRGLLTQLGVPAGNDVRGDWLTSIVTLTGADGYQIVFSLGELEPTLTGRRTLVVYERDGQPLAGNEAPLRVIVEGDRRPSRSIGQLVAIRVSEPTRRAARRQE